jgi:organic radical activating enzyme
MQQGLTYLDRSLRGMSVEEYDSHFLRPHRYLRSIVLDSDNKVRVPYTDFYLAFGCNLKCKNCSLLNPFRSGIVAKDKLIESFEKWSERVVPATVALLGGEPFLNPDAAEIAAAAKNAFTQSQIAIITNGMLLAKVPDKILQSLSENGISVGISQHLNTDEFKQTLERAAERLEQFSIKYRIHDCYTNWAKMLATDAQNAPVPCSSNAEIAYKSCSCCKYVTAIHGDTLYRCSLVANMVFAVKEGVLNSDWHRVLKHQPATLESTPQEIFDYLRGGAMAECSICPEKWEQTEARQLTSEEVKVIKERLREEKRKAA